MRGFIVSGEVVLHQFGIVLESSSVPFGTHCSVLTSKTALGGAREGSETNVAKPKTKTLQYYSFGQMVSKWDQTLQGW